jgi:DNA-binding CsgD family transcriptional regulator
VIGVLGPAGVSGLLERDVELGFLGGLLDRAGGGVGSVVVVEGAAGIGKSGLLAALGARARARGFGVLLARGSEFEAEMAFGVARQLFEPMLRTASAAQRRRLVGGVAAVGARALGVEAGEVAADRFAAIHGLYWLCANRSAVGPLVIVVDDAQWADDPSLAWLGYLARRAADLALLLVVGLRSGDQGGERGELVRLLGDDRVDRIALGPLSAAAVAEIVRAQLDADAEERFCAACSELTAGNPLFVRELVAAARGEGLAARGVSVPALRRIAPSAVGPSVLARLARLGADAVSLARAVAVLGGGVEVVIAAELAELDPVVAELTADRLAAAQIFASVRPLEFFHPLIEAAVYGDLAVGECRLAHRRAAALIDRAGSLDRVAAHLLACGPAGDRWVVRRLREQASEALDRGAPEIAASYARRALAEPPAENERAALLLTLGTAEWRAGLPDGIEHLEQAIAGAGGDPGTLIAASYLLAWAYVVSDRHERAVEVLERTLAAVEHQPALLAVTLEAGLVAVGIMNDRTAPAALRRAEALRARLDGLADPPVLLLAALAICAARGNRTAEAQELTERALACQPYPPPLRLHGLLIITLTMVERYDALQRLCDDLLAQARPRGRMHEIVGVLLCRASASCDCGALADAEADARWGLERAERIFQMQAICELIRVLIERDALDQAEDELARIVDPRESRTIAAARVVYARGGLRAAQGRLEEALDDLLECGRRCALLGVLTPSLPWRGEAALVHSALGNHGEARRLAAEQLELARAGGRRPRTLGISLRASGLVQGGEAGIELLAEAVKTLDGSRAPLELARALTDHGAMLRRVGQRVLARSQLERGLDLAHHLGARRIAAQARGELIAAGAKPRRDAITGRDALTASELRVARLAADGLTNREIAQALFITTKTASAHLSRVYRKVDIRRREQVADALSGRLGASSQDPPTAPTTIP